MAEPVQTTTTKMKALRSLANQLPVANSRVAAGQTAARNMQLQQAVQKAPTAAPVTQTAQATGAATAAEAGGQQVAAAGQTIKQGAELGQVGLAEQARASEERLAGLKQGAREQEIQNVERLGRISENAKNQVYDNQMQFKRDEAGRTLMNERQLMDYAALTARNGEEFSNYQQKAEQMHKRKVQYMEIAYQKVLEKLNQEYAVAEQHEDQKTMMEIQELKNEAARQMNQTKNDAANEMARKQAIGTVIGTVIGGIAGGAGGAGAGGSIGGGLGSMG